MLSQHDLTMTQSAWQSEFKCSIKSNKFVVRQLWRKAHDNQHSLDLFCSEGLILQQASDPKQHENANQRQEHD